MIGTIDRADDGARRSDYLAGRAVAVLCGGDRVQSALWIRQGANCYFNEGGLNPGGERLIFTKLSKILRTSFGSVITANIRSGVQAATTDKRFDSVELIRFFIALG